MFVLAKFNPIASILTSGPLCGARGTALRGFATIMSGSTDANPFGLRWHRSMIRCKDPDASLPYYQERYGMKLVDVYHHEHVGKSNYYLASLRQGEAWPDPGTKEAHKRLFDMEYCCVELQHDHGAEKKAELRYCNGNEEPHRGFGHLAFLTNDVYKASDELLKAGVSFKKKPDEGRMKGLAFAYDPDGYWIELVARASEAGHPEPYNLGQTMLRIKDVERTLDFYTGPGGMGMTKVCERHFDDFSLYFLQSLPREDTLSLPDPESPEAYKRMGRSWQPVLELTHNHGTEKDNDFSYHSGNSEPEGFGYLGFTVDDLEGASRSLTEKGSHKIPEPLGFEGKLARFTDPDGYHVQIALRGGILQ